MLWGVFLWALAHLCCNGDLAAMLVFISLAIFALLDMASANRRGAVLSQTAVPYYRDFIIIIIGIFVYLAVLLIHPASPSLIIMD